jgi:hypothetical protein
VWSRITGPVIVSIRHCEEYGTTEPEVRWWRRVKAAAATTDCARLGCSASVGTVINLPLPPCAPTASRCRRLNMLTMLIGADSCP